MAHDLKPGTASSAESYALSPMQQGMLVESLSAPASGVDVTQVICTLPETIDSSRLDAAWQQVVDRQAVLRTSFHSDSATGARQQVHGKVTVPFSVHDWTNRPNFEDDFKALVATERASQFDPAKVPLMRLALVRLGAKNFRLIWTFHHLLIDARSIALVLQEVFALYEGESNALSEPRSYHTFIDWLQTLDERKAEAFWRKHLKGFSTPTPLPMAGTREGSAASAESELLLPQQLTGQLRTCAKDNGVTFNTMVQGAWALLLGRYSGEEDVVFGAVRAGRRSTVEGAEEMVGVFINTVPVRVRISPERRLSAWLKELREQWVAVRPYEHTALAKVHASSEVPKGRRLFETVVNVQDPSWDAALKAQGGLWAKRDFRIINQPAFPLALDVYAAKETVLKAVYDPEQFSADAIGRMLGHLRTLLSAMAADVSQCLSNIPLLAPEEERQLLVEWNRTSVEIPNVCVHELVEQQAAARPDATAVVFEERQLTYGELNDRADGIAAKLRALGIGPDVLTAVIAERSPEFVIGIFAVLKAGGAYVPIDPAYPQERIAYMLEETAAPVVLTQSSLASKLPPTTAQIICVDAEPLPSRSDQRPAPNAASPENLAYVIYTSGSTGKPKGVQIQHRGLTNLVQWHQRTYALQAGDRATQLASPAFDAAVWEIWPYLAVGASIFIPNEETRLAPAKLVKWLAANQIQFCFMPTPLAEEALNESWPPETALKVLLTGGDKLRRHPAPGMPFKVVNHYGPTESSVVTTAGEVASQSNARLAPSIGRPIDNTRVYILDRYLRAVPVGIPGELYVAGSGLARGYLKQPELTAERFVPNPFDAASSLYRTGDVVRYLADGNIEFLGRVDQQVKIRGYRIETGEVEVCLNQHPAVKQCAVLAREDAGETQLIAYIVGSGQSDELRSFLRESLPEYMIPAAFVSLDHLPLTANGKLDRAALPIPVLEKSDGISPRTATEEIVAGIWKDLLGKAAIPVEANFFELGGHSLLAARVSSRLEAVFGIDLPLDEFFARPTVAAIAERIDARQKDQATVRAAAIRRRSQQDRLVVSFAQERLWFMERLQPGLPVNNIPLAIKIRGPLNVSALREALNRLVARHDVLRTSFRSVQGRPTAECQTREPWFEVVELSAFAPVERETALTRISNEEAGRPFNLEHAPLLRTKLLRLGSEEHVLLLTTHHIASDGWSVGVFYKELGAIYDAVCHDQTEALKPLPITYSDYAAWQRDWLQGAVLEKQLGYWQVQLKGAPTVLDLPADRPRPAVQSYRGATRYFALPNTLASGLQALAQKQDVTLFMLLMAGFQSLLHRYSGQDDLLVGSPVAGRTRIETEGLVGLFLNNLVFRAKFSNGITFRELLQQTRQTALGAYAHQDLPFEKLVESMQIERDLSRSPLFQVMFVLQNTPLQPLELSGVTLNPLPVHSGTAKYDLTLGLEEKPDGLAGYIEYSTDLFSDTAMVRLLGHFQTLLESIVKEPDQKIANISILTPAERDQLLVEWNATTAPYAENCVHQLIEAQVERTPEAIALAFEEEELTYLELNRRANRLAHHLRSLGVGPEVRVGICVHRSIEMMVALLAVHKAGGAYVPLDPSYPAERLTFMLQDSGSTVLVTQESLLSKLPFAADKTVDLDAFDFESQSAELDANPQSGVTPENIAYVIYTSGSTGQPKGVMVLHRNVANFFTGMDARIGAEVGVWLAVTSISFDISVLELFWTLSRGFKVVIQSDESAFRAGGSAQPQQNRTTARKIDFSLFYFASEAGGGRDQYRLLIDGAKFADESGFTAVWTPERHFHQFGGLYPNPSVTSAAIAMVTNRVQLRAGSVVLPLHHPVRVAEEWSVVDNLSNGRAAISFASGWHANDFVFAPANYVSRRQLMFRDIEVFRRLWRGEKVQMPGGSGENVNVRIFPQPVQREIPCWLTSSGDPETFRMAGELGLNILTHLSGQSMEQLAEKIAIYRKAWKGSSRQGRGQVSLMLHTFVWTDMDAAWKKVRKPLWDYLKNYRDLSKHGATPKVSGDIEAMLNEAVNRYFGMTGLFGPPEHCCKTVEKMRDLGVDDIACLIDFGVDMDSVLHSLRHLQTVKEKSNRTVFTGARTYSVPEQIERHGVTHFQCTPSLLSMLVEDAEAVSALKRVKKIMVGGEAFPAALGQRLQGGAEIINMYGPTETTIWSTTQRVETGAPVSIGRPIANTQIYIVDRQLQPVPVNVPGELLIGGAGVARGYLNRAELTAERFITSPFGGAPDARLYRTGDLARYLANGEIEYLGRTDHQVKLRGFRIELGEIEAALRQHPGIRESAVVVREVGANDKRLFAYVTANSEQRPSVLDLKRFLKERLPDYMVPSNVVFMEALPLTPNGKIDRKALPSPEVRRSEGEGGFTPAKTEMERTVARIWEEVLHVERVGLNENFFELGGHSLLAAQVQARLAETLQVDLPIIKLFQYPTVSALAGYLKEDPKERVSFHKVQDRARRQREAFAWRNQPTAEVAL